MADNWKWLDNAFQGLAYWMGYQGIRFARHPVREIAVTTELACLLDGPARGKGLRVDCEKTFSRIVGERLHVPDEYRRNRVDLALVGKDQALVQLAMEVKVINGKVPFRRNEGWHEDLKRLSWLKSQRADLETRLVILTKQPLPKEWLTDKLRAVRTLQYYPSHGVGFKVKRVLRALPYLPGLDEGQNIRLNGGPCVVVLEPVEGCGMPVGVQAKR